MYESMRADRVSAPDARESTPLQAPSISLPKGCGAIRGIGEKFAANPVTGTGAITVRVASAVVLGSSDAADLWCEDEITGRRVGLV